MALPNMPGVLPSPAQDMDPQQIQEQMMIKTMQTAMESCVGKTVVSGTMGFGLGGVFGLFMSSMRYDTPLGAGVPGAAGGTSIADLPIKEQLRNGFKDMGRSAWSSARNFGYIGAVFAGTECCIEGLRAKNDLYNGVAAGCFTGGWLARSGGPRAALVGALGFGAFSAAIDAYMRMEHIDRGADPI
ncbi:putative mitochondrial import inner membrane translocase subunit [Piedraia hortae CBS 480.64]|uniref:Mitochondrial import inner membrane translocase subunit TIM22 n=1 Tax=Piedraia hortae CBS 480.64 TaxID=1314780 RepID=A0A6A7C6N5_9PEZI|nr:putative mitochondrial import inner membrane translocase subunit [Piedraia hortae CBS 480.64]